MRNTTRIFASLVTICLYLGLAQVATAAYLGGITVDKKAADVLPYSTVVTVSLDYKIDALEGALIFVRPYTYGDLVIGYATEVSTLIAAGVGSMTQWFTITSGAQSVTHLRVFMTSLDHNEVYLETLIPVNLTFGYNGAFNFEMNHGQHSRLLHGESLVINFDYGTEWWGDVRVYARPFTNGSLTPGYTASGSAVLPASGSSTQSFAFSGDADVTDIRFQILDSSSELLLEFFVPYEIYWRQVGVYDITMDWADGEYLQNNQHLTASFTMKHVETDEVRVWTAGTFGGLWPAGSAQQPSGPIGQGPQLVTRYSFVSYGAGDLDGVNFVIDLGPDELMNFTVPVDYHYAPNVIQNHVFTPASPAILTNGEHLDITYDYVLDDTESTLIYARPAYDLGILSGAFAAGSPVHAPPSGSGDFFVGFLSGEHQVDSMRMQIVNLDQSVTIYEQFVPGWWSFGTSAMVTPVPEQIPSAVAQLNPAYPNPFNPSTTVPVFLTRDTKVELKVYDVRGRLVKTLFDGDLAAGSHSFTFRGNAHPSGNYYTRLETAEGILTQAMTLVK